MPAAISSSIDRRWVVAASRMTGPIVRHPAVRVWVYCVSLVIESTGTALLEGLVVAPLPGCTASCSCSCYSCCCCPASIVVQLPATAGAAEAVQQQQQMLQLLCNCHMTRQAAVHVCACESSICKCALCAWTVNTWAHATKMKQSTRESSTGTMNSTHLQCCLCVSVCVRREKRKIIDHKYGNNCDTHFVGHWQQSSGNRVEATVEFLSKVKSRKIIRICHQKTGFPILQSGATSHLKSLNTLDMPLNRAQLRTLTLMKIVFPQVLENAANDLQMFGTCVFIKCFQVSARGMQRFPFLTCCHLHARCYLLICVCVCVHCACVALCDCSVQLFWRHVLIIKHRCHKHSHHTYAQTLALSCNKHLVVYPVNC